MSGRVLCVDSDPNLCAIIGEALGAQGYRVEARHDGLAALEAVSTDDFDLALIDIQLPRRDGFEVLESIRALRTPACDIPVFLLTGTRITAGYKERARAARATALVKKPIPLDKLHALVKKHIKDAPPRVFERERPAVAKSAASAAAPSVAHASAKPARAKAIALEGELRDLDFASLLHHLHGLRATGALILTHARRRKVVQVREGYPVGVKSNLIGECFGNLLVQRGAIDQAAFEESVARMKAGEGLQGRILVAMQVMSEEEVARALLEQAEEKLLEVFEWKRGRYEFKQGARLAGGLALPQGRAPASWVLEGVRARMPIERIDRRLRRRADQFVARADSPFYRLQDVELADVERQLVDGLDGKQRVGSFLRSDERVRRALYGLIVTGLLDTRAAGGDADGRRATDRASGGRKRDERGERDLRTELAASAERMRRQTDFEVLGVGTDASVEEIEAGFEEVARRAHPDRFQHSSQSVRALADEVFARIEAAHERLRDPRKRQEYLLELQRGERRAAQEKEEARKLEAEVEFQRGEALLRERKYEAALLCFGNALERNPAEGEYHAHYGYCLFLIHQDETAMVEEAIEHVKRGLKLARDHEKPYLFLGRLYKAIGQGGAAEKMFTRAVQIRPDSVEALRELRLINMRKNKKGLIGRILRR